MPRVVMFSPTWARRESKPRLPRVVQELGVDEVHLAQVRLRWVARHARAVLHRRARVRVAFDAEPGHQLDAFDRELAEHVLGRTGAPRPRRPAHGGSAQAAMSPT